MPIQIRDIQGYSTFEASKAVADFFFKRAEERVDELITPHLVPVYVRKVSPHGNTSEPKLIQVDTGFRVQWEGRPLLISAAHVFYGHRFDEEPLDKEQYEGTIIKSLRSIEKRVLKRYPDDPRTTWSQWKANPQNFV